VLRRAHDHHRDLRTRLPAAAVAYPIDRARQFITTTPLSPSPITASVRRRYLPGTGHASPTATVSAAFGRQNLQHRIPDHHAHHTQRRQNQRPAGRSTVVLSGTQRSDQQRRQIPHRRTPASVRTPPAVSSLEASDACLRAPPRVYVWQASETPYESRPPRRRQRHRAGWLIRV
jgi:hypothetical protein